MTSAIKKSPYIESTDSDCSERPEYSKDSQHTDSNWQSIWFVEVSKADSEKQGNPQTMAWILILIISVVTWHEKVQPSISQLLGSVKKWESI